MLSAILRRLQGGNLEVFKFGTYVLFPIGWMYYFGTNLEERFSVPDFWPREEHSHKIPLEKSEIEAELARMDREKERKRLRRLELENAAAAAATAATMGESAGVERS
ncbi:mitochondrial cytochrome c oxidase assembly factor [Coccidioides immitis RS]|uniref:Mitochondrial cytochrome c oxidase assembly factor n=4 Tax=Coccidioides immitis TaxID=5501 RepID=J3K115_COCIM|nr:mitochondrial cytochrome c oxidase assembly factor [Coccidioides immitis RS]KMP09570.1 cytochrome c oxidase assembly factor [Coccidioides immitis RMSCC 2394]KMU76936.1 mitochondrial cytochrome c oxidase assembly factor [Coccidioides immitis RMSCC 3703]KMU90885.1 hypothetical protein CIHG_08541 [Coccidioides immitis H538.4]TPX20364.1 hypothetical protein DIZ76_016252 [Coccidioides immitis]EAS27604.3 mitochondrial cytochrome c oxidase assembly factor [Coccidioides immitis RS]